MILANVNIGTGPSAGDGDPLRTAFTTINNNFQIVTNNVNALTNSVTSVAGRTGNVVLTINDIVGYTAYVTQANLNTANTAMKGYVDTKITANISALVNSAPTVLDTIRELADAIGDDPNFAVNIALSVSSANTAMKGYVDGQISAVNSAVTLANTIQSGQVGAANLAITAANVGMKGYVDSQTFYSNAKVATYLQAGNISNVSVAGNITATYFLGNGALLTGIVAGGSSYSNVQVQSYLTTSGYTTAVNTAAISANVLTLDFNLSTQIVTHDANISNVAIANGPGNLSTKSMTVVLSQDATGGRTIAGYYKTQDGLGLDIDTTALAVNIYTFLAVNNGSGTSLYAFSNGTNFI